MMTGIVVGKVEKEDCSKVQEQHWRKNGDPKNDVYGGLDLVVNLYRLHH